MQFAIDERSNRVHIEQAAPDQEYFCPICGGKVIQRRGQKNIHHFAHRNACSDNWHYEEMSEWHRAWQERYPEECREVVIGCHRADVLINGTVIEFQHSSMSEAEFEERSRFYTEEGYKLVWLLDGKERMPVAKNSFVYTQNEDGQITGGVEPLTEDEFVQRSIDGTLGVVYDELHLIRDKNGEDVYYGCPINECASQDKCIQCPHRVGYGCYTVKYAGRFAEYKYPVYLNGNDFVYFDDDGEMHQVTVPAAPYPGQSILELAIDYEAKVLGVRNLESGNSYKVGDPVNQYHYYGKIQGFFRKDDGGYFGRGDIYYHNRPQWVVEWCYH